MQLARKKKAPTVPVSRSETLRKYIAALLEEETLSSREISQLMRITEQDVCSHLEHLRKTLNKNNRHLDVSPAQCEKCGFIFKKRDRISKPGKCPLCHSSLIHAPRFHILQKQITNSK